MMPLLEDLEGLFKEEVIAEVKRCLKLGREKYGMVVHNEQAIIDSFLLTLGFEIENNTTPHK